VERAAVLTGREKQMLADPGPASALQDVFFVFLTEMPQCGQNRIGTGLSETAKSGIANDPAKIAQFFEIIDASLAFRDIRQDAQGVI